ncbi:hypothetical protein [Blastococcus sp. CT_GayMR16]|uniref:hypothetical protein n=1 Tax=Blastococcus sp. CT_GayMR16 TaxID=2559607 RepID=UPI001073D29C|nr:hypothetical protein [Blastococcus sp. CT_GayMR16]TFV86173.1 hypothetical protein E4P38_18140 [Blastococcus sp. CT_GayMR16]
MTEQAEAWERVDSAAVERRSRAREPLFVLALAAVAAAWAGASDRFFGAAGTAKWLVVGGYVLFFALLLVVQRLQPRVRVRSGEGYRLQYAIREHVDPGPGIRDKADRLAVYMAQIVWFRWWLLLFIPAGALVAAPWGDRPLVVVPCALVLVAGVATYALSVRRFYAAAHRWVDDPPGPAREMPSLPRWQRWISGWRFVWALLTVLLVAVGLGVLAVLTR